MIDFAHASDSELAVICKFVDAVTLVTPSLIFESTAWCEIIHLLKNELIARNNWALLTTK